MEAEKKRAEEAKRKELYDLMKVSRCVTKLDTRMDEYFYKKTRFAILSRF